MANKITYTDKIQVNPKKTHVNQFWADDANELKNKHNLNDDRTTVLENDFLTLETTGALTYQTLVLLQAVSPVPDEGTPAKVVNDPDPSNNGFYSVVSGAWVKDDVVDGTKNAYNFGFLSTNNGEDNVTALQNALTGGGEIIVDVAGTYDINASILIPSNTTIKFGKDVYIRKVSFNGSSPRYAFINDGAWTKTTNENITIDGLHLIANSIETGSDSTAAIVGLRGHVNGFYVDNFNITNFTMLDVGTVAFCIQICTFENIKIENVHIEGEKDGIHLGKGNNFLIRNAKIETYDDPIALNGHDYVTGNPEIGWITNGVIDNVYDLSAATATGFFCRMLAGAWVDWFTGMSIQHGDAIIASNGRMYRSNNTTDGTIYTSTTEPTHTSGTVTHESINWVMTEDAAATYTGGVKNVSFSNIFLQKNRNYAFGYMFSNDDFSRSYYPDADVPIQDNFVFNNVVQSGTLINVVLAKTPITSIKINNSSFIEPFLSFEDLGTSGLVYNDTDISFNAVTFNGSGSSQVMSSQYSTTARLVNCFKTDATYIPTYAVNVNVVEDNVNEIKEFETITVEKILSDDILYVQGGVTGSGYSWTPNTSTVAILDHISANRVFLSLVAQNQAEIWFGSLTSQNRGRLSYDFTDDSMGLWLAESKKVSITSVGDLSTTGNLGGTYLRMSQSYTVSTLPSGVLGDIAVVTDGLSPTYRGTATGGGAENCLVFHTGSGWIFN